MKEPATETRECVIQPTDYTFECVNDFVYSVDAQFEDLQALCLGMAIEIERLKKTLLWKDEEEEA